MKYLCQSLDGSLRHFLSFFRLPGEALRQSIYNSQKHSLVSLAVPSSRCWQTVQAQKIDRMMEKFAEKYCNDNPDRFANADCAFVLDLGECKTCKTGQTDD